MFLVFLMRTFKVGKLEQPFTLRLFKDYFKPGFPTGVEMGWLFNIWWEEGGLSQYMGRAWGKWGIKTVFLKSR